jgi:hypothetical protein
LAARKMLLSADEAVVIDGEADEACEEALHKNKAETVIGRW